MLMYFFYKVESNNNNININERFIYISFEIFVFHFKLYKIVGRLSTNQSITVQNLNFFNKNRGIMVAPHYLLIIFRILIKFNENMFDKKQNFQ